MWLGRNRCVLRTAWPGVCVKTHADRVDKHRQHVIKRPMIDAATSNTLSHNTIADRFDSADLYQAAGTWRTSHISPHISNLGHKHIEERLVRIVSGRLLQDERLDLLVEAFVCGQAVDSIEKV